MDSWMICDEIYMEEYCDNNNEYVKINKLDENIDINLIINQPMNPIFKKTYDLSIEIEKVSNLNEHTFKLDLNRMIFIYNGMKNFDLFRNYLINDNNYNIFMKLCNQTIMATPLILFVTKYEMDDKYFRECGDYLKIYIMNDLIYSSKILDIADSNNNKILAKIYFYVEIEISKNKYTLMWKFI